MAPATERIEYPPPVDTKPGAVTLEDLIDELARVFHEAETARVLVLRARFPAADLPAFDIPRVFWSRVIRAAADGKLIGGVRALVDEVARQYPGNEVFATYRAQEHDPGGRRHEAPPYSVPGTTRPTWHAHHGRIQATEGTPASPDRYDPPAEPSPQPVKEPDEVVNPPETAPSASLTTQADAATHGNDDDRDATIGQQALPRGNQSNPRQSPFSLWNVGPGLLLAAAVITWWFTAGSERSGTLPETATRRGSATSMGPDPDAEAGAGASAPIDGSTSLGASPEEPPETAAQGGEGATGASQDTESPLLTTGDEPGSDLGDRHEPKSTKSRDTRARKPQRSQEATKALKDGKAACSQKKLEEARDAFRHLNPADRTEMEKFCAAQGVNLRQR